MAGKASYAWWNASDDIIEVLKERIKTEAPETAVVDSVKFEEYSYMEERLTRIERRDSYHKNSNQTEITHPLQYAPMLAHRN